MEKKIENAFAQNEIPLALLEDYKKSCVETNNLSRDRYRLYTLRKLRLQGEYEHAVHVARGILENSDIHPLIKNEIELEISVNYFCLGEYQKCISSCFKILNATETTPKINAKVYSMLGNAHWKSGNSRYALGYFQKCLKLSQQLDDSSLISLSYNGLGLIYFIDNSVNNLSKARLNFEKSKAYTSPLL
ncbi:MAG: hypothetical protein ACK45H_13120, partial [Bacteroidota bacterium]